MQEVFLMKKYIWQNSSGQGNSMTDFFPTKKPVCQNLSRQRNLFDRILQFKGNYMPTNFWTTNLYAIWILDKEDARILLDEETYISALPVNIISFDRCKNISEMLSRTPAIKVFCQTICHKLCPLIYALSSQFFSRLQKKIF